MTKRLSTTQLIVFSKLTKVVQATFVAAIALNLWTSPSLAGDPFLRREPHPIGDKTEAAFKAIFQRSSQNPVQSDTATQYNWCQRQLKSAVVPFRGAPC